MNKEQRKFWVTCPQCRKAFGAEPRFITKYLERVIAQYRQRFSALAELLESSQEETERRAEDAAKKRAQ